MTADAEVMRAQADRIEYMNGARAAHHPIDAHSLARHPFLADHVVV